MFRAEMEGEDGVVKGVYTVADQQGNVQTQPVVILLLLSPAGLKYQGMRETDRSRYLVSTSSSSWLAL